jgi:hypothetical protein
VSVEDIADLQVMRFETMPQEFHEAWIPSKTPAGRELRHRPFSDPSLGDRGRMTSELIYLIATGHVVHPTTPSFANMFGHPDIVYVPIADLPPLTSALVWRRGLTDPTARAFVRITRDLTITTASAAEEGSVRQTV